MYSSRTFGPAWSNGWGSTSPRCARFEQIIDLWHGATQGYFTRLEGENAVLETFSATPEIYSIQYEEYSHPISRLRNLASCGCMIGDISTGTVRPGASGTRSAMTYDVIEEDVRVHKKGLAQIAKIYFAAGAIEVHPGVIGAGTFDSVEKLEKFLVDVPVDRMSIYASHPMGTCRMSSDKTKGVVKTTGESWDVEGLYVSDASVFPTSLGVNPQITVMSGDLHARRHRGQRIRRRAWPGPARTGRRRPLSRTAPHRIDPGRSRTDPVSGGPGLPTRASRRPGGSDLRGHTGARRPSRSAALGARVADDRLVDQPFDRSTVVGEHPAVPQRGACPGRCVGQ